MPVINCVYQRGNVGLQRSRSRQKELYRIANKITTALRMCEAGNDNCITCHYNKNPQYPYHYCRAALMRDAAHLLDALRSTKPDLCSNCIDDIVPSLRFRPM